MGLFVHAGHGLTYENVGPVAQIPEIEELNIGHSVMSRAIMVGMRTAVEEMKKALGSRSWEQQQQRR
jgi:pyridoxine 5-phosphate synthase